MKQKLTEYLTKEGYNVVDYGTNSTDMVDYCDYAFKVGEAVVKKEVDYGILLCNTGIGMSIAANKVKGAYAALVSDVYSAERARLSNDANIACMGAFTSGSKNREAMATAFLTNEFVKGCSSQPKIDVFIEYDKER